MKRVFLIGYMGSGKTTLGKAYSAATGLQFVDLDWYIEERMHKSISDLFAERGEDGFRLLEQKMLHEAGEFENVLIACGGGTPCFFDAHGYHGEGDNEADDEIRGGEGEQRNPLLHRNVHAINLQRQYRIRMQNLAEFILHHS